MVPFSLLVETAFSFGFLAPWAEPGPGKAGAGAAPGTAHLRAPGTAPGRSKESRLLGRPAA